MQGLRNGSIDGLYAQAPFIEGYNAMTSLVKYLRGAGAAKNPVKPRVPTSNTASPLKFITKADLSTPPRPRNSSTSQAVRDSLQSRRLGRGRSAPAGPSAHRSPDKEGSQTMTGPSPVDLVISHGYVRDDGRGPPGVHATAPSPITRPRHRRRRRRRPSPRRIRGRRGSSTRPERSCTPASSSATPT